MYTASQNSHLGFMPAATVAAAGLGPVGVAFVIGVSVVGLYETFKDWFQRGELKIAATAKAEEYVDSVWGTRTPNSPPEQDSVSKLIEACQLDAAQEMINFLARQMFEKSKDDSYFERWMKEYGFLTLTQIQNKLNAYRGYCAITELPQSQPDPVSCPADFQLQNGVCTPLACPDGFYLSGGKCVPLSPATLPPAIDNTGQYVPLPQATLTKTGMFGILAAALAIIVISR
jgi:hypothetical protein